MLQKVRVSGWSVGERKTRDGRSGEAKAGRMTHLCEWKTVGLGGVALQRTEQCFVESEGIKN